MARLLYCTVPLLGGSAGGQAGRGPGGRLVVEAQALQVSQQLVQLQLLLRDDLQVVGQGVKQHMALRDHHVSAQGREERERAGLEVTHGQMYTHTQK